MDNEKINLRKKDFFTSIILFFLGLWIIYQAFQMPIKDSYAGVRNVWYVSPALFPLIIGTGLVILSIILFRIAVKVVGLSYFKTGLKKFIKFKLEERDFRFIAILTLFGFYVYMFIPRIDFFICTALFLMAFISIFYQEEMALLKKLYRFFLTGSLIFLLYFLFGINQIVDEKVFIYLSDILVLLFFILYCLYGFFKTGKDKLLRARYKTSLIVAALVPLIISPLFKYWLNVILPKEGLIIEIMNTIYYKFF